MQAAQVLSGYTLGAADLLRRAMGKKIKEEMDDQRALFVKGAKDFSGVEAEKANYIFDQIAKFAGYGFNKAHSAGYALIGYWTAWLKANYPVEFMAASMTLDKGNTDKLSVFKQALDRMKIKLLPPDVRVSGTDFQVENDAVRYALAALKGVGAAAMDSLIEVRKSHKFNDIYEFVEVVPSLSKKQLEMLAASGALDGLHGNRAQCHKAAEMLIRHGQRVREEQESGQDSLFGGAQGSDIALSRPPMPNDTDWDHLDRLSYEFEAIGFFLSAHPLDGRDNQFKRLNIVSYAYLEEKMQNSSTLRVQMAAVLIKKQERISSKSGKKYAFLQLSDSTGVYEVMVFSETLAQIRDLLEPGRSLILTVDAEVKDDQMRLIGQMVGDLETIVDNTVRGCQIKLNTVDAIQELKAILDESGDGDIKLTLFYPVNDNQTAKIRLNGNYGFYSDVRRKVMNVNGVESVSDV